MIELILIRHGETDSNRKATFCGWTDVELNASGIEQANNTKNKLQDIKVDAIFSSPLKRAVKTAQIINENYGLEVVCCDSLKERNFGVWEDLPYSEISALYPNECKIWESDWQNYCIHGGESALHAYERVAEFVDSIVKTGKPGAYILVTHLGCIRNIASYFLGMGIEGIWKFKADNGSISKIIINDDGYAYLTMLNA